MMTAALALAFTVLWWDKLMLLDLRRLMRNCTCQYVVFKPMTGAVWLAYIVSAGLAFVALKVNGVCP